MKHNNKLIHESSPYLLQHAHNPVNWYAWNEETLALAKQSNKLMLISIGYSACHWCHVMEKECFEDEQVAKIMNDNFINIKVDREERPDVDMLYMQAVQLMTGQGGWPLNCFALPDGKPVYGGTYFPKQKWMNVLINLSDTFANDSEKVYEYALSLSTGMKKSEALSIQPNSEKELQFADLENCVRNWETRFDTTNGGMMRAPKFPMPNNYLFLLKYAKFAKDAKVARQVELTLGKMAFGGIYDHLAGGFARYSTDMIWKVPHFEKMLYDNAQLISLYSVAFRENPNALYEEVVVQTLNFIDREMTSPEGLFYSAYDADSEGVEGKYYVWKKKELQETLKDNYPLFANYYNINEYGYWEHENYILIRKEDTDSFLTRWNISNAELLEKLSDCRDTLMDIRSKRVKPGLDDKQLISWNGLMIKAYADAYMTFKHEHYLKVANKALNFVLLKCVNHDMSLFHSYKNGKASITGFLEDYAFVIESCISLYAASFDEKYLEAADGFMRYCLTQFYDEESGMFFFTNKNSTELLLRSKEIADNVIPSSNSSMANSLFLLAKYLGDQRYREIAEMQIKSIIPAMIEYGSAYSNWAMLYLDMVQDFKEIVVVGLGAKEAAEHLRNECSVNGVFMASETLSNLAPFQNRYKKDQLNIYICVNNTCKLPLSNVDDAIKQLKEV